MAIIIWNSDLIIDVAQIDEEHRHLVVLVNQIHETVQSGSAKRALGELLPEIIAATEVHFKNEEDLMLKNNYPDHLLQHMVHQNLLAQIYSVSHQLNQGEMQFSPDTMDFLVEWLNDHIQRDDRKFGDFLHQRGPA